MSKHTTHDANLLVSVTVDVYEQAPVASSGILVVLLKALAAVVAGLIWLAGWAIVGICRLLVAMLSLAWRAAVAVVGGVWSAVVRLVRAVGALWARPRAYPVVIEPMAEPVAVEIPLMVEWPVRKEKVDAA